MIHGRLVREAKTRKILKLRKALYSRFIYSVHKTVYQIELLTGPRSQSHVQTFATKFWHVQNFATIMIRRDFRDEAELA